VPDREAAVHHPSGKSLRFNLIHVFSSRNVRMNVPISIPQRNERQTS
jgi:hypothetical protein